MSALVVRTLAEWLAGNGGTLVAGMSPPALDRAVEGVARPRRFTPSALAAIDVHEVVLTASDAFPPDADFTLDALITLLADSQAALIVAGYHHAQMLPINDPTRLPMRWHFPCSASLLPPTLRTSHARSTISCAPNKPNWNVACAMPIPH